MKKRTSYSQVNTDPKMNRKFHLVVKGDSKLPLTNSWQFQFCEEDDGGDRDEGDDGEDDYDVDAVL